MKSAFPCTVKGWDTYSWCLPEMGIHKTTFLSLLSKRCLKKSRSLCQKLIFGLCKLQLGLGWAAVKNVGYFKLKFNKFFWTNSIEKHFKNTIFRKSFK